MDIVGSMESTLKKTKMKTKYLIFRRDDSDTEFTQVDGVMHEEGDDNWFEMELTTTIECAAFDGDMERMDTEDFFFLDKIDAEKIKNSIYTVIETEYAVNGEFDYWYIVKERPTINQILTHIKNEE
jgi:hypothetical protein